MQFQYNKQHKQRRTAQNSAEQRRAILKWSENFNKSVAQAVEPLCDLDGDGDSDGDGIVNSGDLAVLWLSTNFNKGAVIVP